MDKTVYKLERSRHLGSQDQWNQFELVYSVQNDEVANGKAFAKLVIHMNVWSGSNHRKLNCKLNVQWITIRDAQGKLLGVEHHTWSYSDALTIPFTINKENFEELGEKISARFLPKRRELRASLLEASNEMIMSAAE